jgi:hypothetical protein
MSDNTKLIAAAPEMLQALTNFVNYLTPGRDRMLDSFIKDASSIIEKVEGQND